jgi:hypothetical protein
MKTELKVESCREQANTKQKYDKQRGREGEE